MFSLEVNFVIPYDQSTDAVMKMTIIHTTWFSGIDNWPYPLIVADSLVTTFEYR